MEDKLRQVTDMRGIEIPGVRRLMGYGPVTYLTPPTSREVAGALSNSPFEQKIEFFDPKAAEIADVDSPGIKETP
jgi:hypothetical protein